MAAFLGNPQRHVVPDDVLPPTIIVPQTDTPTVTITQAAGNAVEIVTAANGDHNVVSSGSQTEVKPERA